MNVRLTTVAVSLGVVTALPAGWAAATPDPGHADRPHTSQGAHSPGDRDHDHVSDDFQGRLARAAAGDRVAVIVTGIGAARAQAKVGGVGHLRRLLIVHGFAARMTAGQARALARTPGVRRVQADGVVRALDDGTDRDFGASYARTDTTPGLDGTGVGICVVDTGIDPGHEQISPRMVRFADFVNGRSTAYDDHGHGTHVAGIAAGDGVGGSSASTYRGVAPGATLLAAKVLDSSGNGSDSQVIQGIEWCVDQPDVRVVTLSLGDTAGGDGTDASSQAVDAAVAAGKVVTVAAGNSGDAPSTINYPGTADGAITVGAVADWSATEASTHDNGTWLAAFSSRGPRVGRPLVKPDIAAPGVTVKSAQAGSPTGYVVKSGTSMATPYVAGAVALGLQAVNGATPAQVRAALESTAVDVGATGKDNEWGAGLIDVRAFVSALRGDATVLRTPMPVQSHVAGTIPANGSVSIPLTVPSDGLTVPIGVTMTSAGSYVCSFSCAFGGSWSPNNDLELRSPGGTVVATSTCKSSGLSCATGRQETIGYAPTVAGTYTLRAYGAGGAFSLDISQGPLGGSVTPPPPATNNAPVANAGPDKTYKSNRKSRSATFTLDGRASTDPDGDPLTYAWSLGGAPVGSGSTLSQTRPQGSYLFTLTVSDGRGGTSTDTVTIKVS
jgi:serine protease AprX